MEAPSLGWLSKRANVNKFAKEEKRKTKDAG